MDVCGGLNLTVQGEARGRGQGGLCTFAGVQGVGVELAGPDWGSNDLV
jgi:hypothetical protein